MQHIFEHFTRVFLKVQLAFVACFGFNETRFENYAISWKHVSHMCAVTCVTCCICVVTCVTCCTGVVTCVTCCICVVKCVTCCSCVVTRVSDAGVVI